MGDRKLLFLMNAEQANAFARLIEAANRGDGGAACRARRHVPRGGWAGSGTARNRHSAGMRAVPWRVTPTGRTTWAPATSTGLGCAQ